MADNTNSDRHPDHQDGEWDDPDAGYQIDPHVLRERCSLERPPTEPAHISTGLRATLLDMSIHGLAAWHSDIAPIILRLAEDRSWLHHGGNAERLTERINARDDIGRLWQLAEELPKVLHRVECAARLEHPATPPTAEEATP